MNKEELYELYVNQELSAVQVGKILGIGRSSVFRRLKKYNIPVRPLKQALNTSSAAERRKDHHNKHISSMLGKRFGGLTVVSRQPNDKRGAVKFLCRCDCGRESVVYSGALINGHTKTCGNHQCKSFLQLITKHGQSTTRLYKRWHGMIQRCENPNHHGFHNYGGRGIQVCPEWHDAATFIEWALSSGYDGVLTLDRINNNGNYEPNNCRWADHVTQNNNRRKAIWV